MACLDLGSDIKKELKLEAVVENLNWAATDSFKVSFPTNTVKGCTPVEQELS